MSQKTYQGHKIFPVKSNTACLLKWSWSTVNLQRGDTSSCHRTNQDPIDVDNFENFHNIPAKILAREKMQQGEWPGRGCEYCYNIEKHNGISDRIMTLDREHTIDKIPPELLKDHTATHVTPTILEIYFNNTCNLSCVYCFPAISSKINEEVHKYGPIEIGDFRQKLFKPDNKNYEQMVDKLWKYLENQDRYKIIRSFHILGGEPLLQKELDQCLNFWQEHPNPSLTINLITNLMLSHDAFVKKMQKFETLVSTNAIFTVAITASIDGWGPMQQYVRHGIDLDLWQKNFEYLLDKPWVNLSVHSCLASLTIKCLPELLERINSWNNKRLIPIDYSFDIVIGPRWKNNAMHPAAIGPGVFEQDFQQIIGLMPENTDYQKTSKKQMMGVSDFINKSQRDHEKIQDLKTYLSELDRRRGTDWKIIFPWLVDIT
jgi:hypothetical protein